MKLNTNLVKVLSDLAAAAENGGINVDININVNVAAPNSEASEKPSQSESNSSEGLVPDGGPEPMIGPYESKKELGEFLNGEKGSEEEMTDCESADTEAVPGSEDSSPVETTSEPKARETTRPRPRPTRPGAPAAGSNGRCINMVRQRQKQLTAMGRKIPEELMVEPDDEAHAQDLLPKLRPYLAS